MAYELGCGVGPAKQLFHNMPFEFDGETSSLLHAKILSSILWVVGSCRISLMHFIKLEGAIPIRFIFKIGEKSILLKPRIPIRFLKLNITQYTKEIMALSLPRVVD